MFRFAITPARLVPHWGWRWGMQRLLWSPPVTPLPGTLLLFIPITINNQYWAIIRGHRINFVEFSLHNNDGSVQIGKYLKHSYRFFTNDLRFVWNRTLNAVLCAPVTTFRCKLLLLVSGVNKTKSLIGLSIMSLWWMYSKFHNMIHIFIARTNQFRIIRLSPARYRFCRQLKQPLVQSVASCCSPIKSDSRCNKHIDSASVSSCSTAQVCVLMCKCWRLWEWTQRC